MSMSRAEVARPIIARVIAKHGKTMTPELRRALRDAYPFGERKYWPYKAWLAEIKRQLDPKPRRRPREALIDNTMDLFTEPK